MITIEQKNAVRAKLIKLKVLVKRDLLARLMFMNPVKIRQAADALLKDGVPCVTDYKQGFRIAKHADEFDEEIRRTERMAKTLLRKVKRLKALRDTLITEGKLIQ